MYSQWPDKEALEIRILHVHNNLKQAAMYQLVMEGNEEKPTSPLSLKITYIIISVHLASM